MTYAANYLVTIRYNGAGGPRSDFDYGVGDFTQEFPTVREVIAAAAARQAEVAANDSRAEIQWIMVEDEDRNVVADITADQAQALASGLQNAADLAVFHGFPPARALRPIATGRYRIVLDGEPTRSWVEPHGEGAFVAHEGPGATGRVAIESTPRLAAAALLDALAARDLVAA